MSKPANEKYKKVCNNFPNRTILTKSVTSGKVQLMSAHTDIGNKFLEKSVAAFDLAGTIESPSFI